MSRPEFGNLTLESMLILPIQRIPRYEMLLQGVLSNTPPSTDEHSPARMRVNGPLSQNKDFQKAFGCAKGTPMNPSKGQCVVW